MRKAIILALALAGSAHAEFVDGNKLLSQIKDSGYFSQGHALGYIAGVADTGLGVIHCPEQPDRRPVKRHGQELP